jgi:virginiamycin B lyase
MRTFTSAFSLATLLVLTACVGHGAAGSSSFLPQPSALTAKAAGPDTASGLVEVPLNTGGGDLSFIAPDLHGKVWFGTGHPVSLLRIDEHTLNFTQYNLPKAFTGPSGFALSPQLDTMWFTDLGGSIGSIDLSNHKIQRFKIATTDSFPIGIAAGPDNAMWFTEYRGGKIGRIGIANHVITEYSMPSSRGAPWGIVQGPDGAMWFSNFDSIGRINTNGHVHLYAIGTNNPAGITTGPDGGVWFTGESDHLGSLLGRIDPSTHTRKLIKYAAGSKGNQDLVFRGSSIYMTRALGGRIDRFDIGGHVIRSRRLPHDYSEPWGITLGSDNQLWFNNMGLNGLAIGKLCPDISYESCKGS